MKRRGFLGLLGAAIAGLGVRAAAAPATRRYGPMTIERHRDLMLRGVYLHVWHHGRDITPQCRFADDTDDGVAEIFLRNADGQPYLTPPVMPGEYKIYRREGTRVVCLTPDRHVATAMVYGVTFQEGAPF